MSEDPKESAKKEEPKKEEPKKEEPKKEETAIEKKEPEKVKPKEYTKEEIEAIASKVETPSDQTPPYKPKYILSPEFEGTSNYETGIKQVRKETQEKLARLRSDPDSNPQQIKLVEEDLRKLDYLFQNYHIGMNVFRTAKGGREKLRE